MGAGLATDTGIHESNHPVNKALETQPVKASDESIQSSNGSHQGSDQSSQTSGQLPQDSDKRSQATDYSNDSGNEESVEEKVDEEEEGECGFCLFMKGGGCKDAFVAWENCIEEVEKENGDIVEKCFEVTAALKKCMDAHADYYEPILKAEKAAEAEVARELEREKEAASKGESVEKDATIAVEQDTESTALEKNAAIGGKSVEKEA